MILAVNESQGVIEDQESAGSTESTRSTESTIRYASLIERADTIHALICDGTFDPWEGLLLIVAPPEEVVEAQRARRRAEAQQAQRRFSPEARARALSLVAGGASYRIAAAAALGDERYRMRVWRWAREQERARA